MISHSRALRRKQYRLACTTRPTMRMWRSNRPGVDGWLLGCRLCCVALPTGQHPDSTLYGPVVQAATSSLLPACGWAHADRSGDLLRDRRAPQDTVDPKSLEVGTLAGHGSLLPTVVLNEGTADRPGRLSHARKGESDDHGGIRGSRSASGS